MKCYVTKNKEGIRLTIAAVSADEDIVGTPTFEQVLEGEDFLGIPYLALLDLCNKPQPAEISIP